MIAASWRSLTTTRSITIRAIVAAGTLVAAPLLDDEAQVDAAAADDVLDRLPCPSSSAVREALAVHLVGDGQQGVSDELAPDAPHDLCLLGRDHELVGMGEVARRLAQAAVAEGIVAAVATVLKERPLHACHPFAVEVALQLGGEAELSEESRAMLRRAQTR